MKSSIAAFVAALIASAAASTGSAGISGSGAELLVIGPVEAVNSADQTATVLGQRVIVSRPETLTVGDTVAVYGQSRLDGSIVAAAIQARGLYVAGATPIFLAGTVQKSEPSIGRVVVNGLAVDLTSAMSSGALSPRIGAKLAVSGIQPSNRGMILVNGISGSGAGVNGISGSGAGVNGISGSGAGVNGISGSGARVSGISGSGAGVNGISGSGAGVNGISGSGARVSGISGSGARVAGISASGMSGSKR
jgi:hypothetical protein